MREDELDSLFAEARGQTPEETEALMARVVADAIMHQPRPTTLPVRRETRQEAGFWSRTAGALGGKGVLAGLATAMMVGAMIGFTQAPSLTVFTDSIFAQTPLDAVELMPGIDAILAEG